MLLLAGLGMQMLSWHVSFCTLLAEQGFAVTRFDNRDAGLSTHLTGGPSPRLSAALQGDLSSASYTLDDMALDTIGLLDALGARRAHLVGQSMGAAIAQTVAARHPERVLSLTSIMSTTGRTSVGAPTPAASAAVMAAPGGDRAAVIEQAVAVARAIGSPGFALDEDDLRERTGVAFDRGFDPIGTVRQILALLSSGDRTGLLATVAARTLVIHGREDPLVDLTGGEATAAAIPGAVLVVIDGMGHDLPRPVWPQVVAEIAATVRRAEAGTGG